MEQRAQKSFVIGEITLLVTISGLTCAVRQPFNSWDRVPYVTNRDDGSTSPIPMRHQINANFIINGYNGVWALE